MALSSLKPYKSALPEDAVARFRSVGNKAARPMLPKLKMCNRDGHILLLPWLFTVMGRRCLQLTLLDLASKQRWGRAEQVMLSCWPEATAFFERFTAVSLMKIRGGVFWSPNPRQCHNEAGPVGIIPLWSSFSEKRQKKETWPAFVLTLFSHTAF